MVEFRTISAQDPLPAGRQVIVMRRLAEDSPSATVIELIIRHGDGHEDTSNPIHPDGTPMSWTDTLALAKAYATEAGLPAVTLVDRTASPLATEILNHDGDHSLTRNTLQDSDIEDDEPGADMRDPDRNTAPRRF